MGYPSKDVVYTQNLSTKKGLGRGKSQRGVPHLSLEVWLSGPGTPQEPELTPGSRVLGAAADLARLIEQKPFQGSTCAKRLQDIDPLPPLPLKPHVAAPGKDQSSGARPWGCGRSFPAARPGQHASVPAHAHASLLLARNIQYL
ncbi:hypothetical protein MJT46_018197 [Ovis ammon polii x Ovis aries]|nr:hypothetical protein MJT46_018197 [Ovis ammon polii x Ovis aries]